MKLSRIHLQNFRNYENEQIAFAEKLNLIGGLNGSGKTNLLDAIHYLSFGKSYFTATDSTNVRYGQSFLRVEGSYDEPSTKVAVKLGRGRKKQLEWNGSTYEKLIEHVGKIPLMMVAPDDSALVKGPSEGRRRLFNMALSQLKRDYLLALLRYNKILKQRNALLKQHDSSRPPEEALLLSYDAALSKEAAFIFEERKQLCADIEEHFHFYHQAITGGKEKVALAYKSSLQEEPLASSLLRERSREIILQRTTQGVHKDELQFTIEEHKLKRSGSQGQQKSYLLALKLALHRWIFKFTEQRPLLLLDDLFDKLDSERVKNLLRLLMQDDFGQVFITDTQSDRLKLLGDELHLEYRLLIIEEGKCKSFDQEIFKP